MTNEPMITTGDIREILQSVQQDREAKKVFLAMPREEQLMAILGMLAFTNSQLAILQKELIELKETNQRHREEREKREKKLADILDTDPNIQALSPDEKQTTVQKILALATRPAKSGMLMDKIASLILMILFILFMMGKLP